MNERPEDRDVLRTVRVIASIVIILVIAFDRFGPILSGEYLALSDTALGLMLGALAALVGVQVVDFLRRSG